MVNLQCQQVGGSLETLFLQTYLVDPKKVVLNGTELSYANEAVIHCGSVYAGDIVYLKNGTVGKVDKFWAVNDTAISVQLSLYQKSTGMDRWATGSPSSSFASVDDILDTVMYARVSNGIRIMPPFKAYLPGVVV